MTDGGKRAHFSHSLGGGIAVAGVLPWWRHCRGRGFVLAGLCLGGGFDLAGAIVELMS